MDETKSTTDCNMLRIKLKLWSGYKVITESVLCIYLIKAIFHEIFIFFCGCFVLQDLGNIRLGDLYIYIHTQNSNNN